MMSSNMLVLLEALLIIGAVVGFGVYQLMSVRRLMKKDRLPDDAGNDERGERDASR
jgi:hypothetical protein